MKLKFFLNKEGKKQYTLKQSSESKPAHYKFIHVRDAPKNSNPKFVRKN